jgi:hypothetical protein
MKDYPLIKTLKISFSVTILGSVAPFVFDQVYTLGSAPLSIQYSSFKVLPNFFDVGPSSVEAYISDGLAIPPQIDLTCNCLFKIND